MKYVGFDKIVETMAQNLHNLKKAYVVGDFAKGIDSPIVEMVLIGELETEYLEQLIKKADKVVSRDIVCTTFKSDAIVDWSVYDVNPLLLWQKDEA